MILRNLQTILNVSTYPISFSQRYNRFKMLPNTINYEGASLYERWRNFRWWFVFTFFADTFLEHFLIRLRMIRQIMFLMLHINQVSDELNKLFATTNHLYLEEKKITSIIHPKSDAHLLNKLKLLKKENKIVEVLEVL
jgi:hypothetical protein